VTPTLLYHYDTPFVPRALAGESGQVALGDHGTGGIWTIDASPPESASARGSVDLGDACAADCEIVQRDGIAYVQDENFGLFTVDVRDPTTPRRLARLDALGHGSGRGVALAVAGQYAYVGTTDWRATMDPELSVVEIADPLAPRVLGQIALPGEVSDIAPGDGHVHAVSGGGLSVVDVADPARPRIVGSLAVGGAYWQIAASGSRVFLVEGNGAFHVVDASQPARPREVGWLDKAREDQLRPNAAQEMVATSTTVYVMHLGWIQAIDVRDPTSPRELGWVSAADLGAPQRFVDMGLDASAPPPADGRGGSHADRLYLASDGNGVFIVDAELVDRPPTTTATPSTTPPSATAPATSATPESTSSATLEAPTSTPVGGPTSASATSTPAATPSSAWRVFLPRVVSPSYLHAAAQG
jgi:hypothetical protein